MRKVSSSVISNQYQQQRQVSQGNQIRYGDKLSAEQIKQFLHEPKQNSESSNFDETIKNQQKMEQIMLKQTFLESNQLFDPIEYFGGLKVSDLNQKVDDSRLSDMFKMMNEEQLTEKGDLISYHVKSVQNALKNQNQGQIDSDNQYNLQQQTSTTSLLGYSLTNQKNLSYNNSTKLLAKQIQSPVGSLQNKDSGQIISSVDKENFDFKNANNGLNNSQVKKSGQFYKSSSAFGSPNTTKQDQIIVQNTHLYPLQNSQQSNSQQNQLPLQQSQQFNKQLLSSVQNSICNSNGKQNNTNEIMISPQQYSKQKVIGNSQQINGNPFFFSFQQNIGFQNTASISQFEIKNQQSLENSKTFNGKNSQITNNFFPSPSITPNKHELNINDSKFDSINCEVQSNNQQAVQSKDLVQKEDVYNRMQLLQAVEQINTESQRKIGDITNNSSTTNKNQTSSSRVLQNVKSDWNKLYSNQLKQQQSLQNIKHNIQQQQNISNESTLMHSMKNNSQTYNQEDQFLFNQSQSQSNFNQTQSQFNQSQSQFNQSSSQFIQSQSQFNQSQSQLNQSQQQLNIQNNGVILQGQQLYQNKANDNIEFYDQSNWQSVQQNISVQHQQSIENGYALQSMNKFEQTSIQSAAFQNGIQSIDKFQDVITSQQMKRGMGLISSINNNPQSQMVEQKQMLEQFYLDKENLELTFQEDTVNQLEEDADIEQINAEFQNQLKQEGSMIFAKHNKSELDSSPQNKTIGQSSSQRYISNKQQLLNNNIAKIVQGQNILIETQNETINNTNQSFINKKLREKSKSMVQGELFQSINQKNIPGTIIQQNIPSRNNSKGSSQKKNNYFVQRQMNSGNTQNKLKHCNSMGISSRQTSNTTSQSKIRDRNQQTRQHQTSYNTSKISSSIIQNDKSQFSYDKSLITNTSNQHINTLNKSILNEKQIQTNISPSAFTNQSYQNQVQGNWNQKLLSHQKKNSVQISSKESFLSPKTHNKNTPRSVSQYTSTDYNNNHSNFYTSHNQSTNQMISQNNNNISQQSIIMSPHVNQTLNNTLIKQNISPGGQYSCVANNINQNFSMAASNYNNQNNGSMTNNNSSTYLKRPSGKSSHYDYKNLINYSNTNQKPRLISSPTQSPSNYKVKQSSNINGQQTIRQKKLMHRLECANSSKNTSVANSYREQQSNCVTINNPQKIQNYANQSNILQSITIGSGKYSTVCDNIDKDLKYNIALEAKKQLFKVDSKYEETFNHFVNMQVKNQNSSLLQSNNSNGTSINQHMSPQSINHSSTNINSSNMAKAQTNNQNFQKLKLNTNSIIYQ